MGVTSNLIGRVMQHHKGTLGDCSRRYGVVSLVWFEVADTIEGAIIAEKRIKRWPRSYKHNLIEKNNPQWRDRAVEFGLPAMGND